MPITRRDLLKRSAAGAAGAAGAGFVGLASALPAGANPEGGYGPLVPDPLGRLDLPPDFSYKIVAAGGNANGVAELTKNTTSPTAPTARGRSSSGATATRSSS